MDFQVFIITGLSGAGKSQSLRILEDLGFFCVDNIPPKLVPTLIDLCLATNGKISGLAVVIDIRTENFLEDFKEMVDTINSKNIPFKILFLEADDEVIVKRYNETRRIHPLLREGKTILESIKLEKERLQEIKTFATDIIDTSQFSLKDLKDNILKILSSFNSSVKSNFLITITSFGFKYGLPIDAHLVFDVRFLPNPFYDPKLRPFSGQAEEVKNFVLSKKEARDFIEYVKNLLDFLVPLYQEEGRNILNIAIGCTGGRHRAVVIADEIFSYLSQKYNTHLFHRDVDKDRNIAK
ncbi:RNase adapter RapZ [Dictyoglomus thermophilum]|uniref:Nucleotide-binding protein DICTH_1001 n=1 Tax=Dictyoglomus thermophilum (strain ATCC 35947 / DSM 3960 / H-6-12) TaxID=309799 RepID=Y1001_DICT6|nr:RNase adapter RapZ [Dictyoglomus thermophilum]B5YE93.1 RecName: Full=Nucleotide-binding protein DICTH_1001 [Dictyoglomus thermophilum H-6-12]ACI18972.1 ATP-binding protein [Dictyoglomus thermophilum H-6-12]MCX7720999.1 RNase adapter RapZ [Dictyoglomus thermophilum]